MPPIVSKTTGRTGKDHTARGRESAAEATRDSEAALARLERRDVAFDRPCRQGDDAIVP